MRHERRALLLGLLLALLLARALRAFLSSVFYESLATLRLNGSAAWMLVLLAPLVAGLVGRRGLPVALGVAGAASAFLPLARFTPVWIPLAALASGAGLLALALAMRRAGVMAGFVAGLAADAALLLLGGSHDPTLAAWSIPLALGATAAALVLALRADEPATAARGALEAVALAALLAVELTFLASPFAAARWLGLPPWGAGLVGLGGLVAGATLARGRAWMLCAIGALGLVDVALVRSPLVALSFLALQLALGAAAVRLAPRASAPIFGGAFAGLAFVLLFFRDPLGLPEWRALVPLLALAPLAAALRLPSPARRAWWPAPVVAALVLLAAMPTPLAEPPEGRELVVVTWNVHQAFGNRGALDPEIYAEALRALDADVVFLQEADTARLSSGGIDIVRYLARELGMHASVGLVGPAILSRAPFVDDAAETAPWSLASAIEVEGTRVTLQSVHFGRSSPVRAEQARALVEAPPGPRIVGGDFNLFEGLARPPYGDLAARYDDAWVAAGHERDDPAGSTFRLPEVRRRIDIVLVEGFEVVSADRVLDERTRLASDHLPVRADLRLRDAARP